MNDLPFVPWLVLFASLFLYVLGASGATVVKDLYIESLTLQQARAMAVFPNAMDPQTGRPMDQELADAISKVVPVDQVTITHNTWAPQPSDVGMKELIINVNENDGSYVTTTMIYGAPLPIAGILDRIGYKQKTPIPMNATFSYYREWGS